MEWKRLRICREAMKQMDNEDYTEVLKQNGMHMIHKYGIACYKKL